MTSPFPCAAGDGGPPAIPGARLDWTGAQIHPLLIWVRTGTAHAYVDGAPAFRITAGQGALLPTDGCEHRGVVTEPGTVAFPLWLDPGSGAPPEPTRFEVPDSWQDWLIQDFNLNVTPFSGRGYSREAITGLLRRSRTQLPAPARSGDAVPAGAPAAPAMPSARGARAVAEELIRDPALALTIQEWATRVLASPRTLLRDFLADTGATFEQWRLACRLGAAVELLTAGYEVDQVAARVGFTSRGGFTHAFKRQFGSTPHRFRRELAAGPPDADLAARTTEARRRSDLVRLARGDDITAAAPQMLPPARTPSHTNDVHVLSWMYRGSGYLDIGDQRYERERGVATWIPAGTEHVTGLRENSISLPLGNAGNADLSLAEPLQVHFSPSWDDYLMHCSISARSRLRPDGYDPRRILDLFAEQLAARRALSVPMPTDRRAHAAAMDYLRGLGAAGGSTTSDVPAEVHRSFREQTGMSFARWRYATRMRLARDLLVGGAKPSAVARRVGYAHLPTFSAAFSRFHGVSPRDYQQRETDGA
ncbi:helix-turn-helix transcriptional regulator [Pseudonocardia phyllosphaerae]|uniref:helix-turn-helix transcriptional regulator n=1 Tax=Pseudonocardia phyllosphaerae TaxID=3390502 RepID=UPI00397C74DE